MSKTARLLLAAFAACAGGAIFTASAAAPAATTTAAGQSPQTVHPSRGMTMAEVLARFGEPVRKLPPAPPASQGPLKPPIERWVYSYFTVYFEHRRVIHTVLTHPHPPPVLTHAPAGGG